MRDWRGTSEPFDVVVIACCSVAHLLTLEDRRRTWSTAFRLLRLGGHFILDLRVPDLATPAEAQRVRPRAFLDLDIDATRTTFGDTSRQLRYSATTYQFGRSRRQSRPSWSPGLTDEIGFVGGQSCARDGRWTRAV